MVWAIVKRGHWFLVCTVWSGEGDYEFHTHMIAPSVESARNLVPHRSEYVDRARYTDLDLRGAVREVWLSPPL